ncbi:hypothetical protein K32_24090 [Kaistia sp. 32K]|uniref:phage head-tail joining protein n=1 Tax=Kaistia sp. 32K TaxID=2795690 RepID=UPI0019167FB0|nr:hypothetical protein [Kaistia sp. 32K]BCP53792.1 hypothetical protein K32_24090 [Kaistia sp. 32K]
MTDFTAEILALKKAIASGATRVSYDGKSVDYDSLDQLLKRLTWLEAQQNVGSGQPRRPTAGFATFSRGDY